MFDQLLNGQCKQALPCLFFPVIVQENISMRDALLDASIQADILVTIAEQYPAPAVIRMTELWSEAAAFGAECVIKNNTFPQITSTVFSDTDELSKLTFPNVINWVTEPLITAIQMAAQRTQKPIFAGITGPYTLGSVLNGSENFMMNCMMEPECIESFLEKLISFLIAYSMEYKRAGAAGIILAEPSISMISPKMAEKFSHQYIRQLIATVQDDDFAVIYHNCGDITAHMSQLVQLGAKAYHFGDASAIEQILQSFPNNCTVMGNIHPNKFNTMTADGIKVEALSLLKRCSDYPNFVLSSGCDLAPNTKLENINALFEAVANYHAQQEDFYR